MGLSSLACDASHARQIAASAFTPDPGNSGNGPIFVSTDEGETWLLNPKLPGGNRTVDITLRFGGASTDRSGASALGSSA